VAFLFFLGYKGCQNNGRKPMAIKSITEFSQNTIRHNWQEAEVNALFALPFNDLVFRAANVHRQNFDANEVQVSTLLSIKTGACPEDCKYCPQSAHYNTGLEKEPLIDLAKVINEAKKAKEAGASRFCMGAAWRSLNDRDLPEVAGMITAVKDMGLETCVTLGMVQKEQLQALKDAGLDYYNHNIDTSEEFYKEIITTRTYEDRLQTLENIRDVGLKTCCGGIVGMGEEVEDRAKMLITLANLPEHPESVPINMLVKVKGTPLDIAGNIDGFDFVRTIAVARIMMPKSYVRLSAGREAMSDEMQALCFFAGANSIFYGEKLLTTPNPKENEDKQLFSRLGINIESSKEIVKELAVF
jgi:biotin synthase